MSANPTPKTMITESRVNGKLVSVHRFIYEKNGVYVLHSEDGPSTEEYDEDGVLQHKSYNINGKLHREDGPARYISAKYDYSSNDSTEYFINGHLHRIDGPAIIRKNSEGKIVYEAYYINGKLHNDNGPAVISFERKHTTKEYYLNGMLHNSKGPAVIIFDEAGEHIGRPAYYINGRYCDTHKKYKQELMLFNSKNNSQTKAITCSGNGTQRISDNIESN